MNRGTGTAVAAASAAVALLAGLTWCSRALRHPDEFAVPPAVVFDGRMYLANVAQHAVPVGRELGTGAYPRWDQFSADDGTITAGEGSAVRVAAVAGVDPRWAVTVPGTWDDTVWTTAQARGRGLAALPPVLRRLLTPPPTCTGAPPFTVTGTSLAGGWGHDLDVSGSPTDVGDDTQTDIWDSRTNFWDSWTGISVSSADVLRIRVDSVSPPGPTLHAATCSTRS